MICVANQFVAVNANKLIFAITMINKICIVDYFGFTTKINGEHGSPLQYSNHLATFIEFVLAYNLCRYLRASDERPTNIYFHIIKIASEPFSGI